MRMGPHMGMSLGLSQSMEQRLEQVQRLTPQQRLELRQQQTIHFGESLDSLRKSGPASDKEALAGTIEQIINRIQNPEIAQAAGQILSLPAIKQAIVKYRHGLAGKDPDILRVIISEVYFPPGGLVEWEGGGTSQIDPAQFRDAVRRPRKYAEDIQALKKSAAAESNVNIAAMRQMEAALNTVLAMGDQMAVTEQLLAYVSKIAGTVDDDQPLLKQFCRNSIVYEKLLPTLSQRILTRFVDRFMQINRHSTAEEYREAFLNVIGEYILVSLGILTPELFRLNRSQVEIDEYENARDSLADDGINLDRLMDHWGLRREGAFFWNRWAVTGMRLSYNTDEMVQEFITGILRQNGDEILAAVGFNAWFSRVKGIVVNAGSNPEQRQRAQDDLREILIATVDNDRVHETLTRLIQGPWFEKLQAFMQPR